MEAKNLNDSLNRTLYIPKMFCIGGGWWIQEESEEEEEEEEEEVFIECTETEKKGEKEEISATPNSSSIFRH